MKRHVLTLGLTVALSSFLPGQPISQKSHSKIPDASSAHLLLAMASPQEQEAAQQASNGQEVGEQPNKHETLIDKWKRKHQERKEKRRRKREAKHRQKELKKEQKEIAKERKKELETENAQIAEREAINNNAPQSAAQTAPAAPPPPPPKATATAPSQQTASAAPAAPPNVNPTAAPPPSPPTTTATAPAPAPPAEARREYRDHPRGTIPVSNGATPAALAAQRNVSRAIYSQVPNSDVMVLVNNYNQIVLRGYAPTASMRDRLLQVASAAAGGYSIVDQLASDAVSGAAGSATTAAMGGASDLIHGSASGSGAGTSGGPPNSPPYNGDQGPYGSAYPPSKGSAGPYASNASLTGLAPGSRGCAKVDNNNQVFLTGEIFSRADADRFRQFAQLLGGANARVIDQLGIRSNGADSSMTSAGISGTSASAPAGAPAQAGIVTPGSVICVNAGSNHEMLLTGMVGSPAEFARVEQSVQPLLGDNRLVDELTAGAIAAAAVPSGAGGTSGTATAANAGPSTSPTATGASVSSSSQPARAGASGATVPVSESEVQQALHSVPRLSNVDARVTADAVVLWGSVDSAADKQMARDIARQYAPNRDVFDDLTVNQRPAATTTR